MSSTGAIWSKQQSNVKWEEYRDFNQMISDRIDEQYFHHNIQVVQNVYNHVVSHVLIIIYYVVLVVRHHIQIYRQC